ncbi:MFS general substrate transporter [Stipitochalara longipes BDJ]|nr:MFS general substrate transporter [Stipitochalara longipes BDJ]
MFKSFFLKLLKESGLTTLWSSPFDTKLLCAQRFIRLVAYGSSTLILVSYLSALGISEAKIGLFMTLTLIGDTALSFIFTVFADSLGRKAVLIFGAVLMSAAGAIFALCGNYWVLLVAAVIGVISPNGNEIGPFRAIEESIIAQITPEDDRGDIYAWYSLLGALGSALGLGICGWVLEFLLNGLGWNTIKAYRTIFWGYSALGGIMLCFVLALSKGCEIKSNPESLKEMDTSSARSDDNDALPPKKKPLPFWKAVKFSHKSKIVVIKLCILFALDSFACSLAPLSWITFFFHDKFKISENKLGTLFFITSFITALSMLPASSVAKRLGNIKTMVFAHLPGAIFLAVIPIPNSISLAVTFLVLRSSTQSMDTAPRSAFLAGVVQSHERTAMMGFVYMARSSASSAGPILTGVLAGKGLLWVAFVLAGSLMVVYDLGILVAFGGHRRLGHDEEGQDESEDEERIGSAQTEDTTIRKSNDGGEKKLEVMINVKEVEPSSLEKD